MKPAKPSGLRKGSLRIRVAAALAVLAWALPATASAHVTAVQPVLDAHTKTRLRLDVPNERDDRAMTSLTVTVPGDMELRRAEPLGAWKPVVDGRTVVWRGGALRPLRTAVFALWVVGPHHAGRRDLDAAQGYPDGRDVRWKVELQVVPAPGPPERLGAAALVALVGAVLVVGGSIVVLLRTRRRALQER
jgi:hypothetical protein